MNDQYHPNKKKITLSQNLPISSDFPPQIDQILSVYLDHDLINDFNETPKPKIQQKSSNHSSNPPKIFPDFFHLIENPSQADFLFQTISQLKKKSSPQNMQLKKKLQYWHHRINALQSVQSKNQINAFKSFLSNQLHLKKFVLVKTKSNTPPQNLDQNIKPHHSFDFLFQKGYSHLNINDFDLPINHPLVQYLFKNQNFLIDLAKNQNLSPILKQYHIQMALALYLKNHILGYLFIADYDPHFLSQFETQKISSWFISFFLSLFNDHVNQSQLL